MTSGTACELEETKRIILGFTIEAQKQIPSSLKRKKKRIIVISGPTCCGKSALALRLAQLMNGEIVSADSMQVYKGMDIGTAKPTQEERFLIPHHLIDVRTIQESFNVVDFYYEARQACQQILDRGNVPIVVGGSGFYLRTFLYGPPNGPPSVPFVRKSLEDEADRVGSEILYERLSAFDPLYARSITKNDRQKIIRALEIIQLTGKKVSELAWKARRIPQNYDFHCWFLHRPKESLYERINARCEEMVKAGFLEEVIELEKQGVRQNSSASQAIGYRQVLDFLTTQRTVEEYEKFIEEFKRATRHYAKRQMTWFRKEPLFHWLDADIYDLEAIVDMIMKDYETLL